MGLLVSRQPSERDYQVANKVQVLEPPRVPPVPAIFGPEHLTNSPHHLAELAAPASQAWTPGG
jgi:hypothetical protein